MRAGASAFACLVEKVGDRWRRHIECTSESRFGNFLCIQKLQDFGAHFVTRVKHTFIIKRHFLNFAEQLLLFRTASTFSNTIYVIISTTFTFAGSFLFFLFFVVFFEKSLRAPIDAVLSPKIKKTNIYYFLKYKIPQKSHSFTHSSRLSIAKNVEVNLNCNQFLSTTRFVSSLFSPKTL